MSDNAAIADRLREARDIRGVTQKELATALGVTRPVISQIEAGTRALRVLEAMKLVARLKIDLDWLLKGEGSPPKPRKK